MNVVVNLAYYPTKAPWNDGREQVVLTDMENWLKARKIQLHPCSAYAALGEEIGSYNFSNDNNFKYLNIRLPNDVAMMFKLTWGAGVV
jgi:hypothetical protein